MDLAWRLDRGFAVSVYKQFETNFLKDYDICLAGSIAKHTSIDNKELDIFVKFKTSLDLEKGTTQLFAYLLKNFKHEFKYQTTPYIIVYYKELKIDIVPCLVSDSEKTLVDNTILHVEYVNKNLVNPAEVIQLKKLLNSYALYGSNTELSGFSGYICELLIIKYTTVMELINNYRTLNLELLCLLDPTCNSRDLMKGVSTKNKLKLIAISKKISLQITYKLSKYVDQFKSGLNLIVLDKIRETNVQKVMKRLLQINKIMGKFYHYFNYTYCFNRIYIEYYTDLDITYKVNGLNLQFANQDKIDKYFSNEKLIGVSNTHYFKTHHKLLNISHEVRQITEAYSDIEIIQINNTNYNAKTKSIIKDYVRANFFI